MTPTFPSPSAKRDSARITLSLACALVLHLVLLSLLKMPPITGSLPPGQFVFNWIQPPDSAPSAGTASGESLLHDEGSMKERDAVTMPTPDREVSVRSKSGHAENPADVAPHPVDLYESANENAGQIPHERDEQAHGTIRPSDQPIAPSSDGAGFVQEKSWREKTGYVPQPNRTGLIESAGKIIRQMAHEQAEQAQETGSLVDRPILPALDRALKRKVAGQRRLVGGLIRITTESGRVYCLQEPPDFARGGPVEATAVATYCP